MVALAAVLALPPVLALVSGYEGPRHGYDKDKETSVQSYAAAARMGAGILECDMTFTKDKELVCRHSQCDLHTTTTFWRPPRHQVLGTVPAGANN